MSVSIVSLIIVLGVLIFFHELGHFLVARLLGVGVER
ncbi:MAG: site-2 protease family protein, partial [Desulfobacterales bacterium]